MPRLSGILIGTGQRLALFAAPNGKTRIASLGERIGAYRILRISPSAVILAGNHRRLVLQPRFDKAAAPDAAALGVAQPSPIAGFVPERR
jgi:hypothetical protein